MKLVLATRSAHKAAEIRRILADVPGLELVDPTDAGVPPGPEEEGLEPYDTFEANARSKARWFREASGLPSLADDSGLAVDALGGAPGVRSKRFSGRTDLDGAALDRANNAHLLERLVTVAPPARTGRYVCVAVLDEGEGRTAVFRGEAGGTVLDRPRGEGGFGYDPLFFDPALGRTFAELSPEEKNERSHRGRAFRALAAYLRGRTG